MNYVTPVGFRDIMSDEALVREDLTNRIRKCFAAYGYLPVETPTLEVLDVMQAGGHVPETPFKFFDSHGDLLAMRPDVTMQVARMCATRPEAFQQRLAYDTPLKLRYSQRVFREKTSDADAREITQCGVECIGDSGVAADAELIGLFAEVLQICGLESFKIALGSAGVLRDLLTLTQAPQVWQNEVLQAYHNSNFVNLETLVEQQPSPAARAILTLPSLRGGKEVLRALRNELVKLDCTCSLDELEQVYDALIDKGLQDKILIDFSVMSSFDYYTGVVFEAYAFGLGSALGSGGRYDNLLASYGAELIPAAGFAFYLDQVMEAIALDREQTTRPLRIAVPKGSLNEGAINALRNAGLDVDGLLDAGRTLLIRNPDVEFMIVRPTDAPIFVAHGAADCGICGEDSLLEASFEVVELVDLKFGGCRFVVAESKGTTDAVMGRYRKLGSIRIATKYPRITRSHFAKKGMQVEVVKLHGNIELGPITGMADRIVDITATGTTLRENNLEVVEEVLSSTARFFANPCSFRTNPKVGQLAKKLQEQAKSNTVQ